MTQSAHDARDLLAERARHLARPLVETGHSGPHGTSAVISMLVVRIGDEHVGVALDQITEVHRTAGLTPIPGARPPVVGAVAWRGRVLTVLDIAPRRSGPAVVAETTRILVLGQRRASFGIIADDVDDVRDVDVHDAAPVDDVDSARREFIRGVTADALVVLDTAALIARFAPTH